MYPGAVTAGMRRLVVCLAVVVCGCGTASKVDPKLVGTWDLQVPGAAGLSRWVWDIHENGTYDFHDEGPGGAPSHSGSLSASGGQYTLVSTTMAWNDTGTYRLEGDNTLVASGKLGTGSWRRVSPAAASVPGAPSPSPDGQPVRTAVVGIYKCSGLPFADLMTLQDDGKYEIDGNAFGTPVFRRGTYTVDGTRVSLQGTLEVQGQPDLDEKDERLEFDRQPDRRLKAAGHMAELPVTCAPDNQK
jgi:hypothetical protein